MSDDAGEDLREFMFPLSEAHELRCLCGLAFSVPLVGPPRPKRFARMLIGFEGGDADDRPGLAIAWETRDITPSATNKGNSVEEVYVLPGVGNVRVTIGINLDAVETGSLPAGQSGAMTFKLEEGNELGIRYVVERHAASVVVIGDHPPQ